MKLWIANCSFVSKYHFWTCLKTHLHVYIYSEFFTFLLSWLFNCKKTLFLHSSHCKVHIKKFYKIDNRHYYIQHSDNQQCGIQHNNKWNATLSIMTPRIMAQRCYAECILCWMFQLSPLYWMPFCWLSLCRVSWRLITGPFN